MKFRKLACFGPRKNAIENVSDPTTFSTTLLIKLYFEKVMIRKNIEIFRNSEQTSFSNRISPLKISIKTLDRMVTFF